MSPLKRSLQTLNSVQIRILGTGTSQGIPVIGCKCPVCRSRDPRDKRLRCSVLVETTNTSLLIDSGPDFRQQMLAANKDNIDAILISHEHNDHIGGLDDVRPINFRWRKEIPLYTDERVAREIRTRFQYIFNPEYHYPGKPRITIKEHGDVSFEIGDIAVQPIRVLHGNLPIWGYRISGFVYITDAKSIPERELDKLQDIEVLVVNALQHRQHGTHFNLEEALEFVQMLGPRKTYLTHLSHELGTHAELLAQLPNGIEPAYDGLEFTL